MKRLSIRTDLILLSFLILNYKNSLLLIYIILFILYFFLLKLDYFSHFFPEYNICENLKIIFLYFIN